jgi:transcription initiation factor TFIIF subunit beta
LEKKDKNIKRIKRDKKEVLDLLFSAFTKQQFYNIKQLEKITRQPTVNISLDSNQLNY